MSKCLFSRTLYANFVISFNEGKPVPNSRDCQEVPFEIGIQVLEIFEKYKSQTSILDDYDYYEMQERARV